MAPHRKRGTDEFNQEKMFHYIVKRIITGVLKNGHRLPTYDQFAEMFDVGHGTVSRVVFALRMCGFVRGVAGGHTYVSDEWRKTAEERFNIRTF